LYWWKVILSVYSRPAPWAIAEREYTDKITFHQYNFAGHQDSYQYRERFNDQDLVLVNGNHFGAKRQIVVLDPKKDKSLQKRLPRLTQVDLILYTKDQPEPYDFLRKHLPDIDQIPRLAYDNAAAVAGFLQEKMEQRRAPLYGLVLAGGKSIRMGRDKGQIDFHGLPQREYAAQLLRGYCDQVFLSGRPDQALDSEYPVIEDTFLGLGRFGGILSAFRAHPDAAWLVLACDLPLLDKPTLEQLIQARNISRMATSFQSPVNEFPEPLITIWEPRAYPVLLQFLAQGYSCPRKALINTEIELIQVENPTALTNVNSPEELEEVKKVLAQKT
jgi:molybdopterin-guanine dinucleotide biosynthesis protein A